MWYQLSFYVPSTHKEAVKTAIFEAGAGRYDNYDCCCFETEGTGQFRPLKGSQPFTGNTDQIEQVPEHKIETVCHSSNVDNVLEALLRTHPYETPAYQLIALARP